jgi:predicted dehydrogenase
MRIAVAGLGFMGSTHIKALKNVPNANLAAVVSADPVKLEGDLSAIQGNIGGPGEKLDFSNVSKYGTLEEAFHDPAIDAVDLCLPTDLHAPAAIAALKAGKHVLVEKPMALETAQTSEMIRAAEQAGRILMCAQVLRFWADYAVLTDLLRDGRLGPVRSAVFRRRCAAPAWSKWMRDPSKSGGGVFDLLIHDADFCLYLWGAPKAVSAVGYEDLPNGIDFITARLDYEGIGAVEITGGWHHRKSYPFSMEYTVQCDGGTIEYASWGRPPEVYQVDGETEKLKLPEKDGFQGELEYFVECCRQGRKPEKCPPEQSAGAVALLKLMLESRKRKGERIECRL